MISDEDFIKGVEFLVANGILKVDNQKSIQPSDSGFDSTYLKTYKNKELKIIINVPSDFTETKRDDQVRLSTSTYTVGNPDDIFTMVLESAPPADKTIDEWIESLNKTKDLEVYKTKLGKYEVIETFSVVNLMPMITVSVLHDDVTNAIAFFFKDNTENLQTIEEIKRSYQYLG